MKTYKVVEKFDIIEFLKNKEDLYHDLIITNGLTIPYINRRRVELPCGNTVSIQRGAQNYCDIREFGLGNYEKEEAEKILFGTMETKDKGEITVELGFPSFIDERLFPYAEDINNPTNTVYGYVPCQLVEDVINDMLVKHNE